MADVRASVDVDHPVTIVYAQWTKFEDFPLFMDGVEEVRRLDGDTLGWRARVAGIDWDWQARIVELEPDRAIAWSGIEGARNRGRVTFESVGPSRTRVELAMDMEFDGWDGAPEGESVAGQLAADLARFCELIESRRADEGSSTPVDDLRWRAMSACRDLPSGVFLAGDVMGAREERAAKAVCADCLVTDDCLAYAITHDVPFGVWGGLSMEERRPLRRSWLDSLAS